MRHPIAVTIVALPLGMISLLAQSVSAAAITNSPEFSSTPTVIAQRYDQWRDRDQNARREAERREAERREAARQEDARRDSRRGDIRREAPRRVWIPGHWESGFLGIGRKWVEGHWETR